MLDLFREYMAADEQHTILFSTHITNDLERIADHLQIMSSGRIVDAGPLDDVVERYAMARGPSAGLTGTARPCVHGLREANGTFDGLIATVDTALFGSEILIEPASIDDIVVHLSQPADQEVSP